MGPSRKPAFAAALAFLLWSPGLCGVADLTYQYDLADFTGRIPYSDARVVVDARRSEVYTVYANEVRVFNNAGMETYRFALDIAVGRVTDLAIDTGGDILMLVFAIGSSDQWSIVRADFRGRPTGVVTVETVPGLVPGRLLLRAGKIWLVSAVQMRAACFLPDGKLERVLDLAELAGLDPRERENAEVSGFDVGADGTIVFGVPVQFRVHSVAPGGAVRSFGKTGSAAGNFGVLGDVALDADGDIFVSDRQRSVVMVFDRDFRFLREAGRIGKGGWIARPGALALDPAGKLYVSQVRNRGVAVFTVVTAP
jgi:hypothetical protein